jgi:phosphoglycolate phosphatase-like HAD superfamily hydrolase
MNVGFDFDMTLVDSSKGVFETTKEVLYIHLGANEIDDSTIWNTVGLPLTRIFENIVPAPLKEACERSYLGFYPTLGIENSTLMPGAVFCLNYLHAMNVPTFLISAKTSVNLHLMLEHHALEFNGVAAGVHGDEKVQFIREFNLEFYVGDQMADAQAAKLANIQSIIVRNQFNSDVEDWEIQPDFVIDSLFQFPTLFEKYFLIR